MKIRAVFLLCVLAVGHLFATPSSIFWTNCTTDVQDFGTVNLNVDNYFTVFNKRGHGQNFRPDVGPLFGILDYHGIQAEAGVDYVGGADDPLYFNGKIGMKEEALGRYIPAWSAGVFNWGTRCHTSGRTNQNIADFVLGKSVPWVGGNLYVGVFSGSKAMGHDRQGVMVGYKRTFWTVKDAGGKEYDKWAFAADYASGKNTIGGGGFAAQYFFTPDISILTGPVWFTTREYNGRWKWSLQLDIGFNYI